MNDAFKQMILRYIVTGLADAHHVVILPPVHGALTPERGQDNRVVFERYPVDGQNRVRRFVMPMPGTVQ